jgi:hypothetical protein
LAVLLTSSLVAGGLSVYTAPAAFASDDNPAVVGSWSKPFEEGGVSTPRCHYVPSDSPYDSRQRLECKPTAVTAAMLPDGRVLYGNGLESQENAESSVVLSLSTASRGGRTRTLDLRDGDPTWHIPKNSRGDGADPTVVKGRTSADCLRTDPAGVLGVPGRPGDGLVGSTAGKLGVPPQDPTCAPDDVAGASDTGDIFCGDIAQLADGRQILAGGTDYYNEPTILEKKQGAPIDAGVVELQGQRSARIFDPRSDAWHATTPMKYGRWYPTATVLPNGKVFVTSGTAKLIKSTQGGQVLRSETYDPGSRQWSQDYSGPASEKTLPENARTFLAPNGKIFYTGDGQMFGPFGQAVDEALFGVQGYFDTRTNQWQSAGLTIPRSSPTDVMLPMSAPYDTMRLLRAGGTFGPPPGTYIATPTTMITTLTKDGKVSNAPGPLMNDPRWFGQGTLLPTGQVLITSGARNDEVVMPGAELPTSVPEIYDPATRTFTSMSLPRRDRTYHNSALLLPNGEILVGGNSPISLGYGVERDLLPGVTGNNDKDSSFEIFDPPYLHQGPRPHIERVQSGLAWGKDFTIDTKDADRVEKVMLMRMPSTQHVMNSNTRALELPFHRTGDGKLEATTPQDGVAAPPGYYYLFIDHPGKASDGHKSGDVPSVARIVKVGDSTDKDEAIEPMSPDTVIHGNGATPVEANTLLNNPPNPLAPPVVPGQPNPLGAPDLGGRPATPQPPTGPAVAPGLVPPVPPAGALVPSAPQGNGPTGSAPSGPTVDNPAPGNSPHSPLPGVLNQMVPGNDTHRTRAGQFLGTGAV